MKISFRALSVISCIVVILAGTSTLHATSYTINGSYWADVLSDSGKNSYVPALGSKGYYNTKKATSTFTVTGTSFDDIFNFYLGWNTHDWYLNKFLTSGGDTVQYSNLLSSLAYLSNIDDGLFQFTGTAALTDGTYSFTHDDGMMLYLEIGGKEVAVISSPSETSAETSSFCVGSGSGCIAAGTYSFTLDYAEVNGAPATLTDSFTAAPAETPEPGSFILLGSGLVAAAAAMRRRFAR
jgi:hypothetical protein